jgi:methionyl-tRNA synthetase
VTEDNREVVELIYRRLDEGGHIARRSIKQLYDEQEGMFLPDRFIRGTCPKCGAEDQYGDSCESCGSTYAPTDLIEPRSAVSGSTPVMRESEHYFFRLSDFESRLKEWMASGTLQTEVANKLQEWFDAACATGTSRATRRTSASDPGHRGQVLLRLAGRPDRLHRELQGAVRTQRPGFRRLVGPDSTAEVHHFIGKDIVYFHTLFWPAMLTGPASGRPPRCTRTVS